MIGSKANRWARRAQDANARRAWRHWVGAALFVTSLSASGAAWARPPATDRHAGAPSEAEPRHPSAPSAAGYTLFEAGPVRPIALLPGGLVAVTNTPDDRVELFRPHDAGLRPCGSIPVGLRPVAAAAVGAELWVVNHLSDSVSVVAIDAGRCSGRVERTLLVGDEPRDIVSATGSRGELFAFVTAAHRGQNVRTKSGEYRDPGLTTPGIGRADVYVYDADALGQLGEEEPLEILTLFTDSPRALAAANGKVYAAGFLSGNRTSLVRYQMVIDRGRQSLDAIDADRDLRIDPGLDASERRIEGGYPAIRGNGRCISAGTIAPPELRANDFIMDVCVRTDATAPDLALEIVPQTPGIVTPDCSCTNALGELQRTPPLIVKFYDSPALCGASFEASLGGCWLEPPQQDELSEPILAQQWNRQVALSLPDRDVFTIDLSKSPPALATGAEFRGVGTTLFNMAVHPKTGKVFVSNTEARNHMRFEGPGGGIAQRDRFANTTVRGHVTESRISILDPHSGAVDPVHLNAHIDFSRCCAQAPNDETENSLAFPTSLAITNKRNRRGEPRRDQDLYVAALGSDKVAVLSTERLEAAGPGEIVQDRADHIEVPGGPVGLSLDEGRGLLYVYARFDNELVVIDTESRSTVQRLPMHSPEPENVVAGRRVLYDARRTSSHGDSACFSCHLFGDMDGLSWDLGAPDEAEFANLGPFFAIPETTSAPLTSHFLPVKGPMTTQSLRGMANHGAMHWRGDRRGGLDSTVHEQPDTGAYDERAAFTAFNVAFAGLNGRASQLPPSVMDRFTDFTLQLTYPPNPIRALDNSLTDAQKRARSRYFGCEIDDESMARGECVDGRNIAEETRQCNCLNPPRFVLGLEERPDSCPAEPRCTLDISDFQNTCNGCHSLDPEANRQFGVDRPGFFGTSGLYTNDAVAHILKVPHLRNMYQKVGMFGSLVTPRGIGLNALPDSIFGPRRGGLFSVQNAHQGDQIRGFGFTHAGEEDTLFRFFSLSGFTRSPSPGGPFVNDNRAGFEPVLPEDSRACFDEQLPTLNARFLSELAAPAQLEAIVADLLILTNPGTDPADQAAAAQRLAGFLLSLPPENPGALFQRLPIDRAVGQLALPLLACSQLPNHAALQGLGCFELSPGAGCETLIDTIRGCSLWGATLEQQFHSETIACQAAGIADKADMESLMMAFDSNLKPIVGQQVTVGRGAGARASQRLALLLSQADRGRCDLVAHDARHGYVYREGMFVRDDGRRILASRMSRAAKPTTFTAVPPGEGRRSGVDRDGNGVLDGRQARGGPRPHAR